MTTHTVYRIDGAGWLAGAQTVAAGEVPAGATQVPPPACGPGERPRWVRGRWHIQPAPPEVAPPLPLALTARRVLASSAFRRLFTFEERVSIDNFEGSGALTAEQKATLRTLHADLWQAGQVHLDDPDTRRGVMLLEAFGLLATGRASQVLEGPVRG